MANIIRQYSYIAVLTVLLVSPFLSTYLNTRPYLYFLNAFSVIYFVIRWNRTIDKAGWLYLTCMLIGFFLHIGVETVFETPMYNFFAWSSIVILYYALNKKQTNNGFLFVFMLSFYLIECLICVYERISHVYLFEYVSEFQALAGTAMDYTSNDFRAHGLLEHPLYNANVISIIMGLILCNHQIKNQYKLIFLVIGAMGLWACNSRSSMVIWLILFVYRFFFYKKNIIVVILSILILYLIAPFLIEFIGRSNLLGRLSFTYENEFSILSRLIAFEVFANQNWTLEKILIGGDIVYYDNTNIGLENGILLDLAFWGWIIGSIKVILELYFTYKSLHLYSNKEKLIIFLAFWGVALSNSNSFQTLIFVYFFIANASLSFNNNLLFMKNKIYENKNSLRSSMWR